MLPPSEEMVPLPLTHRGQELETGRQEMDATLKSHLSHSVDMKGTEPLIEHNRGLRGHRRQEPGRYPSAQRQEPGRYTSAQEELMGAVL